MCYLTDARVFVNLKNLKNFAKKKINSERVTNEHNKEIPKERYISPEERQNIIDDLG